MIHNNRFFQAAVVTTVATAAFVAAVPQADAAFSDVTPNTEAAKAIDKLVAQNIVSGYTDGTFKPKNQVTRAEAAKILTLINTKGGNIPFYFAAFSDVTNDHWAFPYISYVNELGLLGGYGGGKFDVNDVLTRGQFAKIIAQQLGKTASNIELPFTDVKKGTWYEAGIKVLLEENITKGTSATTFSPNQPITREQLAIFFDRAGLLDTKPVKFTSLDELANKGVVYDTATFAEVVHFVNAQESVISPLNNTVAPRFSDFAGENRIYDPKNGTFGYVTYKGEEPSHFFNITFDKKGVKQFKAWTMEGFEQHVRANLTGSAKLESFLSEINNQYNPTELSIYTDKGEIGVINFSDTFHYLEFEQSKKMTLFVDYNNDDTGVYGNKAFEVTPTMKNGLHDFAITEIPVLLEVPIEEDLSFIDIVASVNDVKYSPIFTFGNEGMLIYAFDSTIANTKIPNGTKITLSFINNETDEEIKYVYEYQNGFKRID